MPKLKTKADGSLRIDKTPGDFTIDVQEKMLAKELKVESKVEAHDLKATEKAEARILHAMERLDTRELKATAKAEALQLQIHDRADTKFLKIEDKAETKELKVTGRMQTSIQTQITTMRGVPVAIFWEHWGYGQLMVGEKRAFMVFGNDLCYIENKPPGTTIVLQFADSGIIRHGWSSAYPALGGIWLEGDIDFEYQPDDILVLTSMLDHWHEVSRTAELQVTIPEAVSVAVGEPCPHPFRLLVGDNNVFMVFGNELQYIEDKPLGTTIVLQFADSGIIRNFQNPTITEYSQISLLDGIDFAYQPNNMLVLTVIDGSWQEVYRKT